ncbi:MAG: hypothetical protein WBX01_05430 [Nitrososphaeraceae archaeon]
MTKIETDNDKIVVLRNKTNEGYFVRDILDNGISNTIIIIFNFSLCNSTA